MPILPSSQSGSQAAGREGLTATPESSRLNPQLWDGVGLVSVSLTLRSRMHTTSLTGQEEGIEHCEDKGPGLLGNGRLQGRSRKHRGERESLMVPEMKESVSTHAHTRAHSDGTGKTVQLKELPWASGRAHLPVIFGGDKRNVHIFRYRRLYPGLPS